MKSHSERILGYLGLLKAWKEDRPPTPSDLKAWQEIWTIGSQDLDLIREMAVKAHRQGKIAWERGDRDRALEIWQESWSLAPREKELLEEIHTLLTGWSADYADTAESYARRLSYLKGANPWEGLSPGIRRYLGASLVSLIILGSLLALLPLLSPLFNPKPEVLEASIPEGPVRILPVSLEENLQSFRLKSPESVLRLYPESAILTLSGKLESPESLYSSLSFRVRMRDSAGNLVQEKEFSPEESKASFWGNGSVLPFRKDFLLPLDQRLEDVRRVDLEASALPAPPWVEKSPQGYLAPESRAGDLRPQLTVQTQNWTQNFFTWNQKLVLAAVNSGTKPLRELSVGLVWKDTQGQALFSRNINLMEPGYPALEAGEKFYYSLNMEFPAEVFPFEKEGFPVMEAEWKTVE